MKKLLFVLIILISVNFSFAQTICKDDPWHSINMTGMKDRFKIIGNLTLHGVPKTVTMGLWYRGTHEDAMSKKTKSGFQVTGIINRSDLNVGPVDPFDISNDILIKADGEFSKQ